MTWTFPHSWSWHQCVWASLICCVLSILFTKRSLTWSPTNGGFSSCFASLKPSHHCGSLLLIIRLRTAELVTSGSQLSAGADVMNSRVVGLLGGKPERSSAGKHFVWPELITPDNEQTQQFIYVSHAWTDRQGVSNLLVTIIRDEPSPSIYNSIQTHKVSETTFFFFFFFLINQLRSSLS